MLRKRPVAILLGIALVLAAATAAIAQSGASGTDPSEVVGVTSDHEDQGNVADVDEGQVGDEDQGNVADVDEGQVGDEDQGNVEDVDEGQVGDEDQGASEDGDQGNSGDEDQGSQGE